MTTKPNSGAEILDNLQGVMSDAQMGRGELTYIGAPKSKKRERDLSAYTAVAALIAERDALRAALTDAVVALECCGKDYPAMTLGQAMLARTTPTQDKANDQQAE